MNLDFEVRMDGVKALRSRIGVGIRELSACRCLIMLSKPRLEPTPHQMGN